MHVSALFVCNILLHVAIDGLLFVGVHFAVVRFECGFTLVEMNRPK